MAADIVVVGGGIAGASTAYHLGRAGASVTLVEPDAIGAHASGNNPGGLNPLYGPGIPGPAQDLARESFRLHFEHEGEIRRLSRTGFAVSRKERLNLATDPDDVAALERLEARYGDEAGFSARWATREELEAFTPRLHAGVIAGLWAAGDAKVDGASYTQAVVRAAQAVGASVVTAEVDGLETDEARVTSVRVGSTSIPCDGVVIATGAWCDGPASWLGIELPVSPVKGELLLVEAHEGVPVDLAWRDAAVYAAGPAQVLLGGTENAADFTEHATESARSRILEQVGRVVPAFAKARVVAQRVGLRPVTPDGMPVIGAAEGWDNAWLALGGGRKGMLYSAAMGLATAQLATEGRTDVSVAASSPSRFRAGAPK